MLDIFVLEVKAFPTPLVFSTLATPTQNQDHVLSATTALLEQPILFRVQRVNIVQTLVLRCAQIVTQVHFVRNKVFLQLVVNAIQVLFASVVRSINNPTITNPVEFALQAISVSVVLNSNAHRDSTLRPLVFQRVILVHQVITVVSARVLSLLFRAPQVTTVMQVLQFLLLVLMAHTHKATRMVLKM